MPEIAVSFNSGGPMVKDKVWLSSAFRVQLIKMGIDKAGSVNELGRQMGYRSRVHPGWSVVQIMQGKQAFPWPRLQKLVDFLGCDMEEVLRHATQRERVTIEGTKSALVTYGMGGYIPR